MKIIALLFFIFTSSYTTLAQSTDFTVQAPSAGGVCDGWLSVQSSGGTAPYTSIWNGTDTLVSDSAAVFHGDTIWNLCAGTYFADIYDAVGVGGHFEFFITSPDYTFGNQYTPTDSIVSVYVEDCSFDYSIPIDDAYLNSITLLDGNNINIDTLISEWHIVQNPDTTIIIDTAIGFFSNSNFVLDAAIYCPDSVVKASNLVGPIIHVSAPIDGTTLTIGGIIQNKNNTLVYPNPFTNNITIKTGEIHQLLGYSIFDITGKIIISKRGFNTTVEPLNLTDIPSGTYFIKLVLNDGYKVKKLIKL